MAVGKNNFPEQMHAVAGFRLGTTSAGIKTPGRKDLVVMALEPGSTVAATFTRNAFCAAPVQLARTNLAAAISPRESSVLQQGIRYLVTNTGNANAGTGSQGLENALVVCNRLAELGGVDPAQVLPYSTGVIGEPLPVQKIVAGLPDALASCREDGWHDAGIGIMTTDTRPKGASCRFELEGQPICITGIAKGAGMIKPDMATMLAYIATDARVAAPLLQRLLSEAVDASFNRVTIDGDTSTNDAVTLVATGLGPEISAEHLETFRARLVAICQELAQGIVRDGEGATKFVSVLVEGGATKAESLRVAYTVAESPLVKTALFASDPNWGRILAAIGRSGIPDLDVDAVSIWLDDVLIAERGGRAASYTEQAGQTVLAADEFCIRVDLGRGKAVETVWTTDLSYEYVRINADYRT